MAVPLIRPPTPSRSHICYTYAVRRHGLLGKVPLSVPFHVHLRPAKSQQQANTVSYSQNRQTPWPVCPLPLLVTVVCFSLLHPITSSLPQFPLYTFPSFPVLLLCVGHHPICIALGPCFLIEHRHVILLLLVGIRCHQISGAKL